VPPVSLVRRRVFFVETSVTAETECPNAKRRRYRGPPELVGAPRRSFSKEAFVCSLVSATGRRWWRSSVLDKGRIISIRRRLSRVEFAIERLSEGLRPTGCRSASKLDTPLHRSLYPPPHLSEFCTVVSAE
jgi:hypothetical protein